MSRSLPLLLLLLLTAGPALAGSILPGFRAEKIAPAEGFVTSLAFDPAGRLHYSVTEGGIFRLDPSGSHRITTLPTASTGNAVLLGIAFRGAEIIAHYVAPDFTADLVSAVDPETGEERVIAELLCAGGKPCSSEHHGGNPIVAPDGTIYVGIGDYGGGHLAQMPDSPGGKIWRIAPDGTATQYARGFRNPFDLVMHPDGTHLIVSDNGAEGDDEIAIVREGENHGWPLTMGHQPPVEGMTLPAYVFPGTVAPTGVALVRGLLPGTTGLLVGGFVTKALYFFPDVDATPLRPITLFTELPGGFYPILDVVQSPSGEIVFATPAAIWRLVPPPRGDANGDGEVTAEDLEALAHELVDGDGPSVLEIHGGSYPGSWGADVNRDGVIDARDLVAWVLLQNQRQRPVRK
ncbi:MAG TPA: PQQ-dependent sugar dehydrogenase [Thermoanaerobaculia bacterium]|nr:PQQ-dependent sugar dehydrogenase [Thermoanaerobaculia bacterium]